MMSNSPAAAPDSDNWQSRQAQNTRRLALWTGGWLVTVALATFGPILLWGDERALSLPAFGLQIAVGIGMILANKRHLLGLDELQQRIHLNAMGVTLGAAVVGGIAYESLHAAGMLPGPARISLLVGFLGITYLVTLIIGLQRYR